MHAQHVAEWNKEEEENDHLQKYGQMEIREKNISEGEESEDSGAMGNRGE